jgi:aspartyl-tRNA(Asn)/glutamyl-tRNA(Gln) amidotransferase subunit A
VPFALGSETSGSILTPSAYCGVTGLRPTYGLVSRYGAMALSWTMDKIGPICRSADDCGVVLQAISGGDSKDSGSAGKNFYHAPQYARKLADLRVAFAPVDFEGLADPAAQPEFRKALEVVRETGVQLRESELPDIPYGPVTGTIISAEGSSVFESLIESGRVDELADQKQIAGLKAGLEIASRDYLKAMRIRTLIQQHFRAMFAGIDVIVAPALYGIAPKVSEPLDGGRRNQQTNERGFRSLVPASNLAGLPALCLPCGFSEGMPIALQLVGPPFSESRLLAIGREFQTRTDWHRRHPKI